MPLCPRGMAGLPDFPCRLYLDTSQALRGAGTLPGASPLEGRGVLRETYYVGVSPLQER